MKKKSKKKVIIFDLDGVLIDSKKNMKISWNKTNKKFKLNKKFKEYFKHVGKPFKEILNALSIEKNLNKIENNYQLESKKNFKKIKLYKGVLETINFLKKKNITIGILTSKDKKRTINFIRKLKIKVDFIQCPHPSLRGKPYPDLFNKIIKEKKLKRKNCLYVGDAKYDFIAAKKANIKFIFARYGYKIGIKKSMFEIKNISQIKNFIK